MPLSDPWMLPRYPCPLGEVQGPLSRTCPSWGTLRPHHCTCGAPNANPWVLARLTAAVLTFDVRNMMRGCRLHLVARYRPSLSVRFFNAANMAPYEDILKGKYPGKLHAKKVVEYIRSKIPNATGVIYVEAKKSKLHEDCDQEEHFRYACSMSFKVS